MAVTTKKNVNKKDEKLSPFQKENLETIKKIQEYKTACEANVVSIMWKNPELVRQANLSLDDFSINIWRVFFQIEYDIIINEGKNVIDKVIVGMYLEKHLKLRKVYEDAGGYSTITDAGTYVKEEAFDGYLQELRKWNAMLKLAKRGWIDRSRISEYVDMSAEDIYDELQVYINDTFANVDQKIKSYDISDGIYDLIDELDEGLAVGLPYLNMPMLTNETAGQLEGNITLVGGLSNVGKSSLARAITIPSIIDKNEKVVVYLNEENQARWQRELLITVCNNILKYDIQKHIIRNGHFTKEVKDKLIEAANWIKENTKNHNITIIPFEKYSTNTVIKLTKKYASMGVKYFVLDTFKLDAGKVNDNSWLELQQNMVAINDTIKSAACNVHILITFQLAKGSVKQRYYTQDNIGVSKNIIDPASTCIMIRDLFPDEMPGEKHELKVYKMGGQKGKSMIPVNLDPSKFYQVVFIVKNREGAHNHQIVLEVDLSRNIYKEIGFCTVPPDLW